MTGTPHTVKSRLTALRTSFWPVPAACAAGAILLAIGLSVLELRVGLPFGNVLPSGLAGARSLLSSIITAMISFTALVFSITVVALQLASSQYSPRVLRTFLQDRVTQFALGTFLATALFAMVVLAALPDLSSARLPELSLAVAMILVLVSSGLFLYYLHHITSIMRVSHIVAAIGAQTRRSIDEHVPRTSAQETTVRLPPPVSVVTAPGPGLVDDIDLGSLARLARAHACAFSVLPTPGDFVVAGQPLVTVHATEAAPPPPVPEARVRAAVTLAVERQAGQDVGFGFRQLADIAERALSPGLNDTTTAIRAIQEAHDLLRRLAARLQHPWLVRDDDGTLRVHATPQSFDSFLAVAIDDVRRAGRDQPRVARLLDAVLADLRTVALPEHLPDILRRLNP
ncbi:MULTISPECIES: DUF2254 domain-containing protein [Micromonospora]|uniref:Membrane protein n=1 Tax=Micromonospora vinacea TaxID=709878 RepID=A0ABS0KB50_9ACTN|nr:DUF2254 domain-containing protein [Micromonospora vinacea]MBG6105857.1 putative membrane protein [Micromonospora vinacea]WSZ77983.1 DUF2254 domain-containing protein [Micromonospora sp. NBC_00860]